MGSGSGARSHVCRPHEQGEQATGVPVQTGCKGGGYVDGRKASEEREEEEAAGMLLEGATRRRDGVSPGRSKALVRGRAELLHRHHLTFTLTHFPLSLLHPPHTPCPPATSPFCRLQTAKMSVPLNPSTVLGFNSAWIRSVPRACPRAQPLLL